MLKKKRIAKFYSVIKYFLITLIIFVGNHAQSQNLTKDQMLYDICFLQSSIHEYCSFLPLLEQRTGINVDKEIEKLKLKIPEEQSSGEFAHHIRQILNILYDGHTGIINKKTIKWYKTSEYNYLATIGNVSLEDTLYADFFYNQINNNVFSKLKCWIKTKYMNGKYYNVRPFSQHGLFMDSGEEITAIDGIPITSYINDNNNQMYFKLWDPVLKQWYCELFTLSLTQLGKQRFTLTINQKQVLLDCSQAVDNITFEHPNTSENPNCFVIDDNVLYFYMPQMINAEWYIQELYRNYTPKINKIIIDIRSNSGGDDNVWKSLLKKIVSKPIKYNFRIGMNSNDILENAIKDFGSIKHINGRTIIENKRVILPDSNSVKYKGKIYVLQDKYTYSAASALSSVAWQNKSLILLGQPSAFISGYTFPALALKLPQSGISFKLAFSTDLSGGNHNPFMDKVEIEIEDENINEYLNKVLFYDYYSCDFLKKRDKFINKILN